MDFLLLPFDGPRQTVRRCLCNSSHLSCTSSSLPTIFLLFSRGHFVSHFPLSFFFSSLFTQAFVVIVVVVDVVSFSVTFRCLFSCHRGSEWRHSIELTWLASLTIFSFYLCMCVCSWPDNQIKEVRGNTVVVSRSRVKVDTWLPCWWPSFSLIRLLILDASYFFLLSSVTHNWHSLRSRERGEREGRKCMQNQKHFSLSPPPLNLALLLETRVGQRKIETSEKKEKTYQACSAKIHILIFTWLVTTATDCQWSERMNQAAGANDVSKEREDVIDLCKWCFSFLQSGRHFLYTRRRWQAWWWSSSWERESSECNISRISYSFLFLSFFFSSFVSLLIASFKMSQMQINYPFSFNPFFRAISSSSVSPVTASVTILFLSLPADLPGLEFFFLFLLRFSSVLLILSNMLLSCS